MGELLLSTEKLTRILDVGSTSITVEAGVTITAIQEALAARGAWFPAGPTWPGAFAGGVVATNAAGAATFKYGSVRSWVDALVVILANGSTFPIRRGRCVESDGALRVPSAGGTFSFRSQAIACRTSSSVRRAITLHPTWT